MDNLQKILKCKSSFLSSAWWSWRLLLLPLLASSLWWSPVTYADETDCDSGSPNGVSAGYDSTGFEQAFNVDMCLGTFSTKMWKYGDPTTSAYVRILSGSGGTVLAECEVTPGSLTSYPTWSDVNCVANVDITSSNYWEVRDATIDASNFYGVWSNTGATPACYTTSAGTCGSPTPTPTPTPSSSGSVTTTVGTVAEELHTMNWILLIGLLCVIGGVTFTYWDKFWEK